MLKPAELPELYRLLAVFSGLPLKTLPALEAAGLRVPGGASEISDAHRALLRLLTQQARIRWVTWGPTGPGYVLTGYGETALDVYHQRYGPAHAPRQAPPLGPLARHRVAVQRGRAQPDPTIDPEAGEE
ncbi:hypothetical protein [Deinococcus hohokamensis]|uniref:Uncharacterized protein n=1 Tax=Deinococcus hohokamensis TaxID=309883 RepID=A0ABV9I454_9DEIO